MAITVAGIDISLLVPALLPHSTAIISLAFVPPTSRTLRLVLALTTVALCLRAIFLRPRDTFISGNLAEYLSAVALHTSCYLLILNVSPPVSAETTGAKLQWGLNAIFSPRMGVHNDRLDPPDMTRLHFLVRRAIVAGLTWIVYSHLSSGILLPGEIYVEDWDSAHDSLIAQLRAETLTLRASHIRLALTIFVHFGAALVLTCAHSACALIAVGIFGSPHLAWPPLFGRPSEAYTLQRWYSHFWHKLSRKAFTLHAAVLTSWIPAPAVRRAMVALLSFAISGMMHTVAAWKPGPCQSVAPFWTFCCFGVVVLLEQAVIVMYKRLHTGLGLRCTRQERFFWRVVGYCWVAFYWVEIGTRPTYAAARCHIKHEGG
nr:hypothetical protein B0A51_01530 [Rachicladosporium sp. CCFEE 5018]